MIRLTTGPPLFQMNRKIYTKTGDRGETRLFDGTPVPKHDLRVEAYGNVDELNSVIGAAMAFNGEADVGGLLERIQRELFAIGAQLADPKFSERKPGKPRLCPEWVSALEEAIDTHQDALPELRHFVLPGGGHAGALLNMARTACRRAERSVTRLGETVSMDTAVIEYLNRLSDLLFVLARAVNHREGIEEIQW